jgi:molybdate transport system substrate-binding protein
MEELAAEFEREHGVKVTMLFGGSQHLLAGVEASRRGDIFLPADESYVAIAKVRGLVAETLPIARMRAVLAVPGGNPRQIATLAGAIQSGVRFGQADPDAAAIGKLTRDALTKAGTWNALRGATLVFKPTVNEIGNDLKLGTVDAAILWDAVAAQYPEFQTVNTPGLEGVRADVTAGVLTCSTQPATALRFMRYIAARDRGAPVFRRNHYDPADGDAWAWEPELRLFAGAMLRPAIERTIAEFQAREGVRVATIYNGCGILVGQMKTGERPDAYFACDTTFMSEVKDLFLDAADVSTNQLVILVPKGNPRGIKSLRDLARPGLRLGVGHEKQCALGALTKTTLLTDGTYDAVAKNIVAQFPTGDLLVNQIAAGSLDAVIAYVSNATGAGDKLDAIAIDIPCAIAAQPVAASRDSKYAQTSARLIEALRSAESRRRFEEQGFRWAK